MAEASGAALKAATAQVAVAKAAFAKAQREVDTAAEGKEASGAALEAAKASLAKYDSTCRNAAKRSAKKAADECAKADAAQKLLVAAAAAELAAAEKAMTTANDELAKALKKVVGVFALERCARASARRCSSCAAPPALPLRRVHLPFPSLFSAASASAGAVAGAAGAGPRGARVRSSGLEAGTRADWRPLRHGLPSHLAAGAVSAQARAILFGLFKLQYVARVAAGAEE